MTPLLPHVREPAGEPDVCAYCCEEWMDVDPTETCPLRELVALVNRRLPALPLYVKATDEGYVNLVDANGYFVLTLTPIQIAAIARVVAGATEPPAWLGQPIPTKAS